MYSPFCTPFTNSKHISRCKLLVRFLSLIDKTRVKGNTHIYVCVGVTVRD